MIGAIIGGALSIGSSIANGIAGNKARKKQKELLAKRKQENEAWYNRKYNEDPLQRADAVRVLTQMNEQIRNRNKAAKGRQAVMGGTDDSVTATREANAKTAADATAQIVANNDARKDQIEQTYLNNKKSLDDAEDKMIVQNAGNGASTIASALGTASSVATALDSLGGKSKSSGKGSQKNGKITDNYDAIDVKGNSYGDDMGKMGTSMA